MNRFILAALAALSIVTLSAQQEPAQQGQRFGRVIQEPERPEPGRLTKRQSEQYAEGRERLAAVTRVNKLVSEFRRALTETNVSAPPFVRSANGGSFRQVGQDLAGSEIVALDAALKDEPIGTQFLWVRLYGANQRLREEVRELRAELGRANGWPPVNDEWPGEEEPPEGDGPPPDDNTEEPPGGDDPPSGDGGDSPPAGEVVARINAGGLASGLFEADRYFSGGTAEEPQTSLEGAYRSERYGERFSYAIPVAEPGTVLVRLHCAEVYWGVFGPASGRRVFSVRAEGALKLQNATFDKPLEPIVLEFEVAVQDGTLDLEFAASEDNASVAGIEVVRR